MGSRAGERFGPSSGRRRRTGTSPASRCWPVHTGRAFPVRCQKGVGPEIHDAPVAARVMNCRRSIIAIPTICSTSSPCGPVEPRMPVPCVPPGKCRHSRLRPRRLLCSFSRIGKGHCRNTSAAVSVLGHRASTCSRWAPGRAIGSPFLPRTGISASTAVRSGCLPSRILPSISRSTSPER